MLRTGRSVLVARQVEADLTMTILESWSVMQLLMVIRDLIGSVYGAGDRVGAQEILAREEGTKGWHSMGCEITNVNAARAYAHSLKWKEGDVKMIETRYRNGRTCFLHRVEQRNDFLVYPIRGGDDD